jgi:hypothetical protein
MGNPVEGLGEDWIAKNGAAKTRFSPSKLSGDLREFAGMGDTTTPTQLSETALRRNVPSSDCGIRVCTEPREDFLPPRSCQSDFPLCRRPFSFLREIRRALLSHLSRAAAHARMPVLFRHLRVCSKHTHPLPCEAILQSACSRPPTALQCSFHVEGAHK